MLEGKENVLPIPERSEIPERFKWNLEDIFPSPDAWEESFAALDARIAVFSPTPAADCRPGFIAAFLDEELAVSKELGRLLVYAGMKSHEDLRVTLYQEMADRAESLSVKHAAAVSFFKPLVLRLPEETVKAFLAEHPVYGFYFHRLLKEKEHVLPEREEALLARSREMAAVPENAFTMLTDADITFPPTPSIEAGRAEMIELTEERYYRLSRSRNRGVRKAAFEGIHETYGRFKNALAALYSGSVKCDAFYAAARGYGSALDAALAGDSVPAAVYDCVVRTASERAALLHGYVALRRRVLGLSLDKLHFYDLNVPLSDEPTDCIPYEEAVETVVEALRPLGADYVAALRRGFDERWIDVYENRGKKKGAYSWGAYGTRPYVLLNYNGTLRDVFTIAHEMGHSLHSWYSHASQPQVYADYSIMSAEVASTTNELLLLEHLKGKAGDTANKKWLLNYSLDMTRTTFYRQAMFAEFELETHSRAAAGEALTPDALCWLWRELCWKYYGPEMEVDEALTMEWARIPHFYSAFYVYQYVTGFAAARAFAGAILGGEGAPYMEFLKSGGSGFPLDLLARAGVDMMSALPAALDSFARELEDARGVFS
ncbi:MAG: oligoendopeptidase F [Synergistaceae bacterium]|jgi:oligoendopeptidase F|nr:oligoendopeptidase F [Synergistaceae bacterium]